MYDRHAYFLSVDAIQPVRTQGLVRTQDPRAHIAVCYNQYNLTSDIRE